MVYMLLIVLAVVVIYFTMTYNSLVAIQENLSKAWANIDVLLKQRHDELPKLIDTCKIYMKHEQSTLEKVIQARSSVQQAQSAHDVKALSSAEGGLRASLGQLFALAEAYPELKADQHFRDLQHRISALENQIADRREFYNDSVNINNTRIRQFPDLIVAGLFGFQAEEMLQFAHEELKDIDVSARFNA